MIDTNHKQCCNAKRRRHTHLHYYRPQTKLREGNVFTGVCPWRRGYLWSHVLSGRGWVSLVPGRFQGVGTHPSQWDLRRGVSTPPPPKKNKTGTWDTTRYSRQVGGTYPTGMMSLYLHYFRTKEMFSGSRFYQQSANGPISPYTVGLIRDVPNRLKITFDV